MTAEILVSMTALLSSIVNLVATERWITISERRGLLARDLHKLHNVMAAKIGGIPLTIIFII
ncbi:MAG: hypothetical protein QW092_07510, partial [Candidatus Korarchaeum sp.]